MRNHDSCSDKVGISEFSFLIELFRALKVFAAKALSPFHMIDWVFRWTNEYQMEQKHIVNGALKMGNNIFYEKEKQFEQNVETETGEISRKPQIFIDQMLKIRKLFTDEEVRNELHTIILTVSRASLT